jgi:hypothetical protein
MKKTFWLYHGKTLITAVRCPATATDHEVIMHALNLHDSTPCCYGLFPSHSPRTIRGMICNARVEKD